MDNTQPWAWRLRADGMDLYADHQRRPPGADPTGRELVISCGAALHHVQVAARAMGWSSDVRRLPDASAPALLAEVRLSPAAPPRSAAGELAALRDRHTDRRRFTSWPVPDERLGLLADVARAHGVGAVALTDAGERFRVELLVGRAQQLQAREVGAAEEDGRDVEGSDGLVVLYAEDDSREAWLRAGEGLSALWLDAVRSGLSVVPLSHVLEVEETRAGCDTRSSAGSPYRCCSCAWAGRRSAAASWCRRPGALSSRSCCPDHPGPRAWSGGDSLL